MNTTSVLMAARKPRADVIQFLLSIGCLQQRADQFEIVNIDDVVLEYMEFGPEHSARYPFPETDDLVSGLIWLQRNGYLFLVGDDAITLNHALGQEMQFSIRALCQAVDASLVRLSAVSAGETMKFA